MKRDTPKKNETRGKGPARREKGEAGHPLEFDRGWQELEAQFDRIRPDWNSLAAQLGIGSKGRAL